MKKARDVVRLRRWCMRRRGEGVPASEVCAAAQIPRRTFYNWVSRHEEGGLDNLIDKPRRPNTIRKTPDEIADRITALRKETGWCSHRIAGYLRKNGIDVCHMTVHRILCREGLNHPLAKPRTKRSYRRWQQAPEQPMAIRLQGRRFILIDHNPRRSQSHRNRVRTLQGGNRG